MVFNGEPGGKCALKIGPPAGGKIESARLRFRRQFLRTVPGVRRALGHDGVGSYGGETRPGAATRGMNCRTRRVFPVINGYKSFFKSGGIWMFFCKTVMY